MNFWTAQRVLLSCNVNIYHQKSKPYFTAASRTSDTFPENSLPIYSPVAEFSATVIATLLGYRIPMGNVKEYIEHYGFTELFRAFVRVKRVVGFVVDKTSIQDFPESDQQCLYSYKHKFKK